jgi:hypothetical protein
MLSIGFLVVGAILLLIGLYQRKKVAASQAWPSTQGTIVDTRVRERAAGVDDESSASYSPVISYTFEVNGTTHTSDRHAFGRVSYATKGQAERRIANYPKGSRVEVFYNPDKPAESVLERSSGTSWILVGVGGGLIIVALALLLI